MNESASRVALTFDAEHPDRRRCPPGNVERILDTLAGAGARATFFIQGRWAESQPAAARRIADERHLVGNHSKFHARMTLLTDEGIRADVSEAEEAIRSITGADPRPWFRCPFGDGRDDPRVLSALDALGYRDVSWHVELADWDPGRTATAIVKDAVAGALSHGDGAVVLLHAWPGPTSDALPAILERLSAGGARFVGIDELESAP